MTEISGPFDTANFGEDGWARMGRLWAPDGVEANYDDELQVIANGGLTTAVKYGNAFVHGFSYRNEASYKTLTHNASTATAGQSRNDFVVLHLSRVNNTIDARIVPGTFAATPVDPVLTQDDSAAVGVWQVLLARVNIVANASAVGAISMFRNLQQAGLPKLVALKKNTTASAVATTETMDAALGYALFTVTDARHWYRVKYKATFVCDTPTGTIVANVRIRDSGTASAPTTTSTQLIAEPVMIAATSGAVTQEGYAEDIVQFTPGVHALGGSYSRAAGTPGVSVQGNRLLSVENLGYLGAQ